MKKIVSIALLLLFLYNVVGYYLIFWGLRYQAQIEMAQRLEMEDYAIGETITFQVPLTVPYYTGGTDYESVTGEFEHNGEFFKLVKQKFERDTLYVVCIRDHQEKKLFNAMTDFVKLSNELPASSERALKLLGSFTHDYVVVPSPVATVHTGWCQSFNFVARPFDLLATELPVFSPPPDLTV